MYNQSINVLYENPFGKYLFNPDITTVGSAKMCPVLNNGFSYTLGLRAEAQIRPALAFLKLHLYTLKKEQG